MSEKKSKSKRRRVTLTEAKQKELQTLVTPVIQWTKENFHPDMFLLVDHNHAEVLVRSVESGKTEIRKEG